MNGHWEVTYDNGIGITEGSIKYEDLARDKIKYFDIYRGEERLFRAEFNGNGSKLVWRRRTGANLSGQPVKEFHILSLASGSVVAIDIVSHVRYHGPKFDEDHPILYPPVFQFGEPGFEPDTV